MIKVLNYLVFVLLPLYLFKVNLFAGASFSVLDVLLLITIFLNFFIIYKKQLFLEFFSLKFHLKISFALLLIGFYISSIINSGAENIINSLGILKSFLYLPVFFAWTSSFLISVKYLSLKKVFCSYLTASTFISILSIIFFSLAKTTFDGRVQLFFDSPNYLAMFLSPAIPIVIFLLYQAQKKPLLRCFLFFILFIHIFSTITTLSLGSFLSLSLLVPVLFLLNPFSIDPKKVQKCLLLGAITLSFLLLFVQKIAIYTDYSQQIPPSSTDSRIVIYEVTRQIIVENYFWGIGAGNFQEKYLSKQPQNPPFPQWAVPHPHNNLLLFLTEGGFLVFVGLVLFITTPWSTKKTPYGVLSFLIISYFIFHGITDTTIWKNDLAIFFWFNLFTLILYPNNSLTSKK